MVTCLTQLSPTDGDGRQAGREPRLGPEGVAGIIRGSPGGRSRDIRATGKLRHPKRDPKKGIVWMSSVDAPDSLVGLVTPAQLADEWQTSVATIYRLIRQDGLPVVRLHDKADYRISPEDAAAWLDRRKVST